MMPLNMGRNFTWLVVVLLAFAGAARAADPHYTTISASPDGIGKVYMGREIARVMSYHGAYWLERPERKEEERPDLVLAALELKPGMKVADVGAGSGYYSSRIAERIGPGGTVYAVDVQPEMLDILRMQMKLQKVTNVTPVLGTETDPKLPPGELDLSIMVDVYHELEYPYETLAAIVKALKPGGRVVFVEFRGNDPSVPIKALHTMTEAQVRREAEAQPLQWVKTVKDLPWQQVIIFRKR
jgi:SAM-dependent methyltransferase